VVAAGRPIIVVGSPTGEFARLVQQAECGFNVELGDSDAFARIVTELAADASQCAKLGENARLMLNSRFTKRRSLELWHSTLRAVSGMPAEVAAPLQPVLAPAVSVDGTAA
jgi:glycosyltransferase involved in cell wall biosynthesis